MRPWLRWFLAVSVVLSAGTLLWPRGDGVTKVTESVKTDAVMSDVSAKSVMTPVAVLPGSLTKAALQRASFDPFVGVVFVAPSVQPSQQPVEVVPPFVAPEAPSINYRYLGRMTDPDGRRWVYLSTNDKELAVSEDTKLDEGYVVESIRPDGVYLTYPSSGTKALIPVPDRATQ